MTQTLTAFFDKRADASKAIAALTDAGILRSNIRLLPETESALSSDYDRPGYRGYDVSSDHHGFWASLSDFLFPEDDKYTYAEALNRGGNMVTVTVEDSDVDTAVAILEEQGTIDLDERESTWRSQGWKGYEGSSGALAEVVAADSDIVDRDYARSTTRSASASDADEVIPVVEEEMRVGKRQVSDGSVRVRSYVVETPVSEEVELRKESVRVERRPVDRAAALGEDAFRERTIEATATSEEAIVSKTQRVKEEIVVKKDAATRTEKISDTVRRTEVVVEDDSSPTPLTRRTAR